LLPFLGADEETRTPNLLFTKQLLCQLSYVGVCASGCSAPAVVVVLTGPCLHVLLVCHEAGGILAPSLLEVDANAREPRGA
jgi:hypothetical protein